MQLAFDTVLPPSSWRATPLAELPSWAGARRISIDLETRDEDLHRLGPGVRRGAYPVGLAFAIEDGPAHYIPMRHLGGDNVDPDQAWAYIRDQFRTFRGTVTGANLQYELDYLLENGVDVSGVEWWRDTTVAEPLLDELQLKYGLQAVAERYNLPGKDEGTLRAAAVAYGTDPKRELWKLPARYVGDYATRDVTLPLQLMRLQERRLEEQDLMGIWDLESRLLPALVRMRRRGVPVDLDRVNGIDEWARDIQQECADRAHALSGYRLAADDFMKAAALEQAFKAVGITVPRTNPDKQNRTRPSVTKEFLSGCKHDLAAAVKRGREFTKLRQFCNSIWEHQVNGRIHCTFNQLRRSNDDSASNDSDDDDDTEGARFGRISATDPNLQQQPVRHKEYGSRWRGIFRALRRYWVSVDYSQQEPRLATHYATLMGLTGAAEFAERYRSDPTTDFHDMTSALTALERKDAKNTGLGIMYGMGGAKLCRTLGLPVETIVTPDGKSRQVAGPAGRRVLEQFDAGVPFLRQLSVECQKVARQRGYIKTVLGRRCRFPSDGRGGYEWLHKALNRLIQGSSADQTKLAVVEMDRAGLPLLLQVHDEVDFETDDLRDARLAGEIMRDVLPLRVPSRPDIEVGPDWGNLDTLPEAA